MISMYQLQIFLSVVERGSFSSAAEELHLTQPAVSMQVRALEERYGVKLFSRVGQRIELTEAGRSLIEPARQLLLQAQQVEEHFSAELGQLRGRLTIAYSRNSAAFLYTLPRILAVFRERHNRVQFFHQQMSEESVLHQVQEREANFGVVSEKPRLKGLECLTLLRDELKLAVPFGHVWSGTTIGFDQLRGVPFIIRSTGSETRRVGEMGLRSAGLTYNDLQVVAEFDTAEGVALAVEQGLGVGFLTETVGQHFAQFNRLALAGLTLETDEDENRAQLSREINIIRLIPTPERQLSPVQERFWEHLRGIAIQ